MPPGPSHKDQGGVTLGSTHAMQPCGCTEARGIYGHPKALGVSGTQGVGASWGLRRLLGRRPWAHSPTCWELWSPASTGPPAGGLFLLQG